MFLSVFLHLSCIVDAGQGETATIHDDGKSKEHD